MFRLNFAVVIVTAFASVGWAEQPVVTNVEFVVGELLKKEGGEAESKDFPFLRPFGIDFDSSGTMYVVELEGGRVFTIKGDGEPVKVSGDGSRSYKGDGGTSLKQLSMGCITSRLTQRIKLTSRIPSITV